MLASADDSGKCGSGVTYFFEESTGTLTISKTGEGIGEITSNPWGTYKNEITKVVIEVGVTSIGLDAFYGCSGLTSVTIGNSVTSIGMIAFYGCSGLTSVNISDIAAWCNIHFKGINPLSYAQHLYLNGEEIKDLIIPNSVTSIGNRAFNGCSGLTSVTIPNSVTSIGNYAFYGCSGLTSVTIGNSVASIGNDAFNGCSGLTSVAIPNSVTSISDRAFEGCSGLTSVTIGNSVASIGDQAFNGCSSLTSVTVGMETPVSIKYSDTFSNRKDATLYVPYGCKAAYEAAYCWKEFKEIVEMAAPIEVTDISQMDNVIYIEPMEARTGTQAVISFKMKNAEEIHSFQFDLCLPEGVTAVKSSNGRIKGALSAGRLPEEDAYTLTFSEHDGGVIHFLCDSQYDDDIFTGNDGEIATLQVNIAETMADGDYAIVMKDMKLSEMDNDNYYQTESLSTRLSVLTYTPGDTNGDNSVTPADAIMILYYYFGVDQTGFNVKAADLNKDGAITPADAIETLYKYFNAGSNNARAARPAAEEVRDPE